MMSPFCLVTLYNCRIRESRSQDLSFKSVAKGTISKGYLDPTDGMARQNIFIAN